jgi:tRNA (cmo5U34)-methyltransferase
MSKDTIYSESGEEVAPFVFDDKVAQVFQDMIGRSVPGYEMSLSMIALISRHFAQENTVLYDLGCSLGASSLALVAGNPVSNISLIGVDNSTAMLSRCRATMKQAHLDCDWELVCEDIIDTSITNASIVILNFTLQFIPIEKRLELLKKIYKGLVPGGVLLVSEKIAFDEPGIQESMTDLHLDFKKSHGYSDLEISGKRSALENVLIPESMETHKARFEAAGFARSGRWFQCFNFASLIAFKE